MSAPADDGKEETKQKRAPWVQAAKVLIVLHPTTRKFIFDQNQPAPEPAKPKGMSLEDLL